MNRLTRNSAKRDHAEMQFAARPRVIDKVKLEREAEVRAGYAKTAKLKSLRLAKEAAEKALIVPKSRARVKDPAV